MLSPPTLPRLSSETKPSDPPPVDGSRRGSSSFCVVVEMAERFAYFGVSSNLITYLTGPLGQPTAAAAANVNVWIGTMAFLPLLWAFVADGCLGRPLGQPTAAAAANVNVWIGTMAFLPLLWAFVADGCLGRFRTIITSSSLYILGLGSLSFSAMIPSHSEDSDQLKVTLFFCSLFLIAIGQSGYKPCAKVFGADQFDGNDLKERQAKSSYFNWLMFGSCVSITTTRLVSTYILENLSWSLGFGIQCVSMLLALLLFLLGTTSYRFTVEREGKKNPFARIGPEKLRIEENKIQI
ncbi:hypothetical protein F2Q70_00044690 [Brassica cretica]|uniref:Uncharacterized protein n=1 Tax=Brassica cretica TaxID=69181 RepID=A0A8S9LKF5_BRACR|nr:hypothetical protein F2Q70_00044690 [Brassica cretica]KAF2606922.1 hypothetical protein F2Q68_00045639 [Brassica cretica]